MAVIKIAKRKTPKYEQIIAMDDDKINVLILGTSGCGKSTLINAILEANKAPTGIGEAVTKEIAIYQNQVLPFRMIDTVGFEYGIFKQNRIKRDIAKFSMEGVRTSNVEKLIHMIWFCIDGTTKRIDQEVLGYIKSVTNSWKNVPVIVVFTKSYSRVEIAENINMAKAAIDKYNANHRRPLNVKDIIPVVAMEYKIDNTVTVPPMGLDVLINRTVELVPEARAISKTAIKEIDLKIKNSMANALIASAATGATVVGAIPIPIPDATILVPIQTSMLTGVAKIYGIQDDASNEIINTILKVGATTMVGRNLLNAIKAIPGINVAASVLNAAVAGAITLGAGEVSNVLFQKVYNKEIELTTVDWDAEITNLFEDYLPGIIDALKKLSIDSNGKVELESIGKVLAALAKSFTKDNKNKQKKK